MTISTDIQKLKRVEKLADPVIVLGAPRSGVRLTASLLAAHPALTSGPQLPFFVTAARSWHDITTKLGANHQRHYGVDPQSVRSAFEVALLAVYARKSSRDPAPRPLIHSLIAGATVGIFAELFPTAQLIYVVRDVRGAVASLLQQSWCNPRTGTRFAYTSDPIAAADYWMSYNMLAHSQLAQLKKSGRLRILRYEELCTHSERTLANLADFLGLDAIAKRVSPGAIETVSGADAAIYPPPHPGKIVTGSVSAWRKTLTHAQEKAILDRAGGLNQAFGYEASGAMLR